MIVAFAGHLVLVVVNTSRGSTTADLAAEGIAVVLVTYSLGRWEEPRRALRTGATIVALVVVAGLIERGNPVASALIGDPIPWILVALTGTVVRHRREARVDQIARTRLAERNDLAREIHDVVAHHVSAIAVQADAALAVAEQDPAAGHQALDAIRRTASLALDEMRSMVGVLRAPDASAELAPTGGRGDLERLVAHQPPHPAVELHTAGIDDLPATIAAAVYRLTQEAVTNARRHARDAGHVIIDVRVLDDPAPGSSGRRRRRRPPPELDGGGLRPHRHARARRVPRWHLRSRAPPRPRLGSAGRAAAREATMTIRVLIADDQELVRSGFAMILDAQPDIEVVAQVADGRQAVERARHLRPDVCLLDVRMPEMDGLAATEALAGPGVVEPLAVVIVTTFDLDEYVYGALKAGARGFLLKDAGAQLLVEAVRAAAAGDALISPSVTARLLESFTAGRTEAPAQPIDRLTDREEEVLAGVAQGLTNQEPGRLPVRVAQHREDPRGRRSWPSSAPATGSRW